MSALAHVSSPGGLEVTLVLERAREASQLDARAAAVLNLRQIMSYREAEIASCWVVRADGPQPGNATA
jgi:hypothetical protein